MTCIAHVSCMCARESTHGRMHDEGTGEKKGAGYGGQGRVGGREGGGKDKAVA